MNPKAIAIITPLIKQGLRPKQIAEQTGYRLAFCQYHCYKKEGGKRGRPTGQTPETLKMIGEANQLRATGWTFQKIADKFKCSKQYIHQLLTNPSVNNFGNSSTPTV